MSDLVEQRVVEVAADVFGVPLSTLSPTTVPDDLDEWESFAQLNLLVAIEDEYAIQFDESELGQMSSLGAIAGLVAAKLP